MVGGGGGGGGGGRQSMHIMSIPPLHSNYAGGCTITKYVPSVLPDAANHKQSGGQSSGHPPCRVSPCS